MSFIMKVVDGAALLLLLHPLSSASIMTFDEYANTAFVHPHREALEY